MRCRRDADRLARESSLHEVRIRLGKLTGKEREVLGMIRDGRPNKEIARAWSHAAQSSSGERA